MINSWNFKIRETEQLHKWIKTQLNSRRAENEKPDCQTPFGCAHWIYGPKSKWRWSASMPSQEFPDKTRLYRMWEGGRRIGFLPTTGTTTTRTATTWRTTRQYPDKTEQFEYRNHRHANFYWSREPVCQWKPRDCIQMQDERGCVFKNGRQLFGETSLYYGSPFSRWNRMRIMSFY